jgi:S-DNA-T family DNA segregation ATPase FtsK/SpoIIIE
MTKSKSRSKSKSGLTAQQKADIFGIVLALVGGLLLLALFSPSQSFLTGGILSVFGLLFGWLAFILPLSLLILGVYIFLRRFSKDLPIPGAEQVIGMFLLFFCALVGIHFLQSAFTGIASADLVALHQGGGWFGGSLLEWFLQQLGVSATAVVLVVWLLLSLLLTFSISLVDIIGVFVNFWQTWMTARAEQTARKGQRSARQLPVYLDEDDEPEATAPPARRVPPERKPERATRAEPAQRTVPASQPPLATPATPAQAKGTPPQSAPAIAGLPTNTQSDTVPGQVWVLPDFSKILRPGTEGKEDDKLDRQRTAIIEETLEAFGAPASVVEVNRGPTITQYGVEPGFLEQRSGKRVKVKVNKIVSLSDDLALALAAASVRIEAPVPGKGFVGIEVPNTEGSTVTLRDIMESESFAKVKGALKIALGKDVSGEALATDLGSMPHLLIAGTTGSGKSVCVNSIICALLLIHTPETLRFIMVDPKRVELTGYNGIPHLLAPVVTDVERVVGTLQWVAREMDGRYTKFAEAGARNIDDYNKKLKNQGQKLLPYLVVIIDELADLMMLAPDETEKIIARLAQMARATGIHVILATQRPSVDVVTGLIKANFPSRISFAVASSIDSRVILDAPGAEKLLGKGDMLFMAADSPAPLRAQGVFVSDGEIQEIVRYWRGAIIPAPTPTPNAEPARTTPPLRVASTPPLSSTPTPQNAQPVVAPGSVGGRRIVSPAPSQPLPWEEDPAEPAAPTRQSGLWEEIEALEREGERDELFDDAVKVVRELKKASISLLQRRLRIGYTRSAKLIDMMEEAGIVGPQKPGAQQREVLNFGSEQKES